MIMVRGLQRICALQQRHLGLPGSSNSVCFGVCTKDRNARSNSTVTATEQYNNTSSTTTSGRRDDRFRQRLLDGPSLQDFVRHSAHAATSEAQLQLSAEEYDSTSDALPYLTSTGYSAVGKSVFYETYGCQMNVNDTEIVRAILQEAGYVEAQSRSKADVVLLMTCAIRESAEQKIRARLKKLRQIQKYRKSTLSNNDRPLTVGLLGCMAERLKQRLLDEEPAVDLIVGPDAYRDLPRLLGTASDTNPAGLEHSRSVNPVCQRLLRTAPEHSLTNRIYGSGVLQSCKGHREAQHNSANPSLATDYSIEINAAVLIDNEAHYVRRLVNVLLSLDETYADISPVRKNANSVSAFVSIMRGCDNMCTYCIVPFTRGKERSRPIDSILREIQELSDQGVKEVTLLGQNVNSYRDLSESSHYGVAEKQTCAELVKGFKTVYKPKKGGRRFADLLDKVSLIDPEIRIRFTSPHPKDFPDEVLGLIRERANICKQIHLPAQSGNDDILEQMGRGYSRESYMDLVHRIWHILGKDVCLTSDFIAGFCGESETAHRDTLELIRQVGYDFVYCFPYSMRQKTRAFRRLQDTVESKVKNRRVDEISEVFRTMALKKHKKLVGSNQLVLIEGVSKRCQDDVAGRNCGGTRVVMRNEALLDDDAAEQRVSRPGDYVLATIKDATSQTLMAKPLKRTRLQTYAASDSAM